MSLILAALWKVIGPMAASFTSKLVSSYSTIIGALLEEERKNLLDAKAKFLAEYQSKGLETAAADALTVFYDESKGSVSKIGLHLFKAFLAAMGVPLS